jgi:hypothetical protein
LHITITTTTTANTSPSTTTTIDTTPGSSSSSIILATGGFEELYRHNYGRLHSRHPHCPLKPLLSSTSSSSPPPPPPLNNIRLFDDDNDDDDEEEDDTVVDEGTIDWNACEMDCVKTYVKIVPNSTKEDWFCSGSSGSGDMENEGMCRKIRGKMEISVCRPAIIVLPRKTNTLQKEIGRNRTQATILQ